MKWISIFLLFLLAISCSKDQVAPGKGNATFSMSQVSRGLKGGRMASTTPSSVLLSIEDNSGNSIFKNKKLSLFSFGQGYESESLELTEGTYKLTQFQILNANDTIIYASPLAGSSLAQYVTNPLPLSFTVTKGASIEVVPQVLAVTSTDTPNNFGYASFGFDVVKIRGKRIKEIWQDEPYNIQYRIYYTYNNPLDTLPAKEITKYYNNNTWSFLDSTTFDYNSFGKVSQTTRYEVFGLANPTESSVNYSYDTNGRLTQITTSGYTNGSNNYIFDFFYDQNGKLSYSHQTLQGNDHFLYLIEYSVNSHDEIDTLSRYSVTPALGKTLQFKYIYQYDQFSSVLPFPFRDSPIGQKHNIIYQRELGYNLIGNPPTLTTTVDCWASSLFQYNPDGKPKSSVVSNPNGCSDIANDDGTKFTYIYE
jgi:hypothetical protein